MPHNDERQGIFSPEDLQEMREALDKEAVAGETDHAREKRARNILHRKDEERDE